MERILGVSTRLFLEKGYENTSLQDILNELGGLTKGAIYHHFKSKEDIFDAVATKMGQANTDIFKSVMGNAGLNGAEKLREILRRHIFSLTTKELIGIVPNLLDNPRFLATQIRQVQDVVTPEFIAPIVEIGARDGSIKTDKPYELAEAITLLVNVWLNPTILGTDAKRMPDKCKVLNEFVASYGFVLIDEDTILEIGKLSK